ncbi:MAG: hypothetical protein MHM6MM_003148 [Cercozoa sp. M6MM]
MASKSTGPVFSELLARDAPSEDVRPEKATFAMGCFWSVQLAFNRLPGVLESRVGYTGGHKENPTYQEVCRGDTGHAEACELTYDANTLSFGDLLRLFWERHDATTLNRQGNDVGTQYRSAIFWHNDEQRQQAEASKAAQGSSVVTEIAEAATFYPAEEYHQNYLAKGGQCSLKGDRSAIRCYG